MAEAEDRAGLQSRLDKPLHLLTEDDISQVTREDCRRYLKSKGMRRPSWNKSQAIQQVISLKTLLEPAPESSLAGDGEAAAAAAPKKLYIPTPQNPPRVALASPSPGKAPPPISLSAENSVPPYQRKEPGTADSSGRVIAADNDSVSPRNMGATSMSMGQMTIFYCGKVNVYDDVPCNKAHAIMQLAASPVHFPQEASCDGRTIPCQLQAASARIAPNSPMVISPPLQTVRTTENSSLSREENNLNREDKLEVPISRKASVQRYLEKRKDRFKSKKKVGIPSSSSLDVYLSHHIGDQTPTELSSRNGASSPSQPRPPQTPTRCSSVENILRDGDLND